VPGDTGIYIYIWGVSNIGGHANAIQLGR